MIPTGTTMSRSQPNGEWPQRVRSFGLRLREAREAAGYSQPALADIMGVSQGNVWQWENGGHLPKTPQDVFRLEHALGCEPGTLSRILGYLPLDVGDLPCTVIDAVTADTRLSEDAKRSLLMQYRLLAQQSG